MVCIYFPNWKILFEKIQRLFCFVNTPMDAPSCGFLKSSSWEAILSPMPKTFFKFVTWACSPALLSGFKWFLAVSKIEMDPRGHRSHSEKSAAGPGGKIHRRRDRDYLCWVDTLCLKQAFAWKSKPIRIHKPRYVS